MYILEDKKKIPASNGSYDIWSKASLPVQTLILGDNLHFGEIYTSGQICKRKQTNTGSAEIDR